jgi:hypothetical protein
MKQHDAVIEVMEKNGGFATLGLLYRKALDVPGVTWGTKTPFASIRRIVQDKRFFYKIRPGLWALKSAGRRPELTNLVESAAKNSQEFDHTYYQGLLVELGNLKLFKTFIPAQDRNRQFLSQKLGDVATLPEYLDFTYERILQRGRNVDVTWFNERGFPDRLFEVEFSTDMQNSMLKFVEFQDFRTSFRIVASKSRVREFESKLGYAAFSAVRDRIGFTSYEQLSEHHTKAHEAAAISRASGL